MTRFAVALGSNQGARMGHLRQAVEELRSLGSIEAVSAVYETEPIGGPAQDPYLNAVVLLDSSLSPHDLLSSLQEIEKTHGREREVRWGPRTLDLDIVAMEGTPVNTEQLQIPHPRAGERRFVLDPLADLWPEAMVGDGLSASAARELVRDQPVVLLSPDWWEDDSEPAPD